MIIIYKVSECIRKGGLMLKLILGKSGAGKSYKMYREMIEESIKCPKENFFAIVPEQFTMETQKDFVSMHPNRGIQNIDVLSFMRLAYRIFEEQGKHQGVVLEDTGKSMLVRKVVEERKEELAAFQNNIKKTGYVNEIKSLLSEFMQYGVKNEEIEKMIEITESKPLLQRKLKDMLIIYNGFQEMLCDKYITAEEILEVLVDCIKTSELLKDSVVLLDGFTGFTPIQYKLLSEMLKQCKEVQISITIDARENIYEIENEYELFHMSKETIIKLLELAREVKCEHKVEWVGVKEVPYRFRENAQLACLEENLFRYPSHSFEQYKKKYGIEKESSDLHMYVAKDVQGEVDYICSEIFRLVKEDGYRYRDIAIVTGDMEMYRRVIEKSFAKRNIPVFLDAKNHIMGNPLVEMVRALIEMFKGNFDYESVFRYLRCGLVDISIEDVDKLENYVIALGIKGKKRWKEPWTRTYGQKDEINLEEINLLREKAMRSLQNIETVFSGRGKTVLSYTIALHEYFQSEQIFHKLKQYEKEFERKEEPVLAKEYGQVYEIVLDILDKIVELLGDEKVSVTEYGELLETGFMEARVGVIPPGVDQILVGDIERTRLKNIRALFFVGVNEGIVPKSGGKGGIISEMEREMLLEQQISLSPTQKQNSYMQHFYLYLNMTKPSEKLYITYHKLNPDGKTALPSFLIGKIKGIFPDLQIAQEKQIYSWEELDENSLWQMIGTDLGKQYLLQGLGRYGQIELKDWWKELFSFYKNQPEFEKQLENLIKGATFVNEENSITSQVAEGLYGKILTNSVTRIEKYAACAYAHFLQYGLQLRERQEFHFGNPDFGTIFHDVLQRFSIKMESENIGWKNIPEEMLIKLAEECLDEVVKDYGNQILNSSKRNEYMIERMRRMVKRTLWALSEQIKMGDFEPTGYEARFSYMDGYKNAQVDLEQERVMRLNGRIDRIDSYQEAGDEKDAIYVKVVDYKTGSTKFEIANLYYGLQIQLVVYMNAALEMKQKSQAEEASREIVPSGIFYYNIDDPILERQEQGADIRTELLKALKMSGLVNDEVSNIQHLDHSFGTDGTLIGSVKSLAIPVDTKKDGTFGSYSSIASRDDFAVMGAYANYILSKQGKEIVDGNIAISPYRMDKKTACDFCSFRAVCNFDVKLPGNQYRDLKKMGKDDIWSKMRKDLGQEEVKENGEGK